MNEKIQFRVEPGLKNRIDKLSEKRELDPSTIVRMALMLGLDCLEQQHFVHFPRLAAIMETTLTMVDMIGAKVGANVAAAPEIAQDRMDHYHVKV